MTSKYSTIHDSLLNKINSNFYACGVMIPTERELTEEYQVTRNTVRRAIDELISEGYLTRRPGSGAFVTSKRIPRSAHSISIQNDLSLHKRFKNITTRIISVIKINATPPIQQLLHLEEAVPVYRIRRIQYGDGRPLVYEDVFLPCCRFTKMTSAECRASLDNVMRTHAQFLYPDDTNTYHIRVEAVNANKKEAAYLQLPLGTALMKLYIQYNGPDGPLCGGVDLYPGDMFNFVTDESMPVSE